MTAPRTAGAPDIAATVDEIRANFPALERRHDGQPVAYFDGPGGTQVPRAVVDAMTDYLLHHNANTHWRLPDERARPTPRSPSARGALADFLGAAPDEVAFGANMTTLTFHLGRALGRGWGPGDEIVVTELDHHANVAPWRALARERGRHRPGRPDGPARPASSTGTTLERGCHATDPARSRSAPPPTRSARSTTCAAAARLAHAVGALIFVDAVHYAPHALVDVRAHRLRLPGLLGLQVLRAARRRAVRPRSDLLDALDVPKLEPAPDTVARAAGDRHAESRGHRRRGGGGRLPGVARLGRRLGARGSQAAFAALHERGQALRRAALEGTWSRLPA